ncbi:hypothetical protein [Tahibacter amnicola]|uniref:STAS domain-containing protein n=1 Tax=Tahibacter amnicola TaxID=2976241 RepID=A0ABY6B870_9GAMM|nr:hypothetical protein [Tahibacter amnicola]UXI65972.1 hypothetical protein N4264_14530 [Tahibacter amnicola]
MNSAAAIQWVREDSGRHALVVSGEWTLSNARTLVTAVDAAASARPSSGYVVEAAGLTALDTTGALLLLRKR